MEGEHILYHQARGLVSRVDTLLRAYTYACVAFFAIATAFAVGLAWAGSYPAAAALFILATAMTGYGYSAVLQRQLHIKDITDRTIDALRSRWDELRKDTDLLQFFAQTDADDVDANTRLRVRLYLSTVFDMYSLIVHYINHGYFQHTERFAAIYEGMIRSLLVYPLVIEVWRSKDSWGKGRLRDEYGDGLTYVVDKLIEEIEDSRSGRRSVSAEMGRTTA